MFPNFAALARLPLADATAISFASPLITVALAAVFLKERVRIYRWSAVLVGFVGVIVMLWPHFDVGHYAATGAAAAATIGSLFALFVRLLQRRLGDPDPPADAKRDHAPRSCSISRWSARSAGALTLPFGWHHADRLAARRADRARRVRRPRAYLADRELSLRRRLGGGAVRLFLDAVGAPARLLGVRRIAERVWSMSARRSSPAPGCS